MDTRWDIRREGRASNEEELESRVALRPEKLEVCKGRLLWSQEERLALLGLLLENVGADEAIKLGNPDVWASAVLGRPHSLFGDPLGREILALFPLTCVLTVGFAVVLRAVPLRSATIAIVLLNLGLGIWASATVDLLLRD